MSRFAPASAAGPRPQLHLRWGAIPWRSGRTRDIEQGLFALSGRLPGIAVRRRQLEARKREARRHRAADQRPGAVTFGALPGPWRDDRLRPLAGRQVGAKSNGLAPAVASNPEQERCTPIEVPYLRRVDPVPARSFALAH